jgi:hypothetical protein
MYYLLPTPFNMERQLEPNMPEYCTPNVKVRLVGPKYRFSTSILDGPSFSQVLHHAREFLLLSDIRDTSKRQFGGSEYGERYVSRARNVRVGCGIKVGDGISTDNEWRTQLGKHVAAERSAEMQVFVNWAESNANHETKSDEVSGL